MKHRYIQGSNTRVLHTLEILVIGRMTKTPESGCTDAQLGVIKKFPD